MAVVVLRIMYILKNNSCPIKLEHHAISFLTILFITHLWRTKMDQKEQTCLPSKHNECQWLLIITLTDFISTWCVNKYTYSIQTTLNNFVQNSTTCCSLTYRNKMSNHSWHCLFLPRDMTIMKNVFSYCHVTTSDSFAKRPENKQDEFNWSIGIY
jgi:hypothetical protein